MTRKEWHDETMNKHIFQLIHINRPIIMGIAVNVLSIIVTILVPLTVKRFIDSNSGDAIDFRWSYGIFGLLLLQAVLTSIGTYIITREGEKQVARIRMQIKRHLLSLPVRYFDDNNSGAISSRVINDATLLRNFLTINIPQMINGVIAILLSLSILLYLDWKLASLLFLIFPLNVMLTLPIGRLSRSISRETQDSLSRLTGMTSESLSNIRTIKHSNAEENVFTRFEGEADRLLGLSIRSDRLYAIINPTQKLFAISLIILVVLYGGYRVGQGSLSTGTMISFMIFLFQLIGPVNSVADFYNHLMRARGSTEKIIEILEETPESNLGRIRTVEGGSGAHHLTLEGIHFGYSDVDAIHDVSMEVRAGEKIAIVGPTGSGKSTTINLITRLYPIRRGRLRLDGVDANRYHLREWRDLFSVVSQDNAILSGSIRHNLTLGLGHVPTEAHILRALEQACLLDEVENLEDGLETLIGEKGMNLSGGQRQRLQIARAILKDAPFLILDEATSSLDSSTERRITSHLDSVQGTKGIVSIAHRLSTIIDADRIYFIDKGKVTGVGTHLELLRRIPKYRHFVESQILETDDATSSNVN